MHPPILRRGSSIVGYVSIVADSDTNSPGLCAKITYSWLQRINPPFILIIDVAPIPVNGGRTI